MIPLAPNNDNLQTPDYITNSLGRIDLDPCAGLTTTIGVTNWSVDRGEDGLKRKWFGFVFCNPPFSQKSLWIEKMASYGNGILLLPERGSAPWFGPLALKTEYYFVLGKKINFKGGSSSNNVGSVLFPFGESAVARLRNCKLPGLFLSVLSFNTRE